MDIAVETLQAFLDDAWDAAASGANSFRDQLRAYEKGITAQFSSVGSLGSVSKNSTNQSYRGPGLGQYTVAQIQTAWRMLINLFDQTKEKTDWLNANSPGFRDEYPSYPTDADQAVYDFTSKWLRNDFSNYQIDLTDLRLHPTLSSGSGALTW